MKPLFKTYLLCMFLCVIETLFELGYNSEFLFIPDVKWYHYITSSHTLGLLYVHHYGLWCVFVFVGSFIVSLKLTLEELKQDDEEEKKKKRQEWLAKKYPS